MKLRTYGLVLTPEGRIVSTRPTLLDDGSSGRVVGWKDNDLAAMDLGTWDATVRPMQVAPPLPRPVRLPTPQASPPVPLASQIEEPEDDWEWEIALARARAAAEETETAVMAAVTPERRRRADTVPPPAPMAVAPVSNNTEPLPAMDTTEPFSRKTEETEAVDDQPEIVRVVRIQDRPHVLPTPVAVPRTMPRASSPVTVIPVPKLPTMRTSSYRPEPVVRSAPPPIPRRVANGTGPVGDKTSPGLAIGDNDPTRPSLTLPRTNRTMPLPAVKHR